jgi:HK97 family phage prohead protease
MSEQVATRPALPVEHRAAEVESVDEEQRVITFIAVPYGQETIVADRDGSPLGEVVERGAFNGIETRSPDNPITINREHDYARTVGKAIAFNTDDPRGLIVDAHISRTALGDETLQLAKDGVLRASVGMAFRRSDAPIRPRAQGHALRTIKRAFLDHVALLPNPAYTGATVLAVREQEESHSVPTPNLDAVLAMLGEPTVRANRANTDPQDTERLMRYWAEGEGAAKIRWGEDGDFDRCVMHLGKYVADPKGLCSNLHVRATGARPGHAPGESDGH